MKSKDFWVWRIFLGITAFFVFDTEQFLLWTRTYPYTMGFFKIGLLATFGQFLKNRIKTGNWFPEKWFWHFLIWGVFGWWFTAAFPFIDFGVVGLADKGLWFANWACFWKSAWINLLSGYAFWMMFVHYWLDSLLAKGWCWPWELFGQRQIANWARVIIKSLFLFWLPAHSLTFFLSSDWRVLSAAYLAIMLGIILSTAEKPKS